MATKDLLIQMRDDARVLAHVAGVEDLAITKAVIGAVAGWFDDVEIMYPIPMMPFSAEERRSLVITIANELASHFDAASKLADEEGDLPASAFETLAAQVDPLWRELSGVFATELNAEFEKRRVPEQHAREYLTGMIDQVAEVEGDEARAEFIENLRSNKVLRSQLRRIGIDPDQA